MNPYPELTTERLVLRQLKETDDKQISVMRSDESVNKYIDRPKQASIDEARAFIRKINDGILQGKWFYWAICLADNPALIGTICLWNFSDDRTTAELGYELLPKFHGQGIMNEAMKRVIQYSFDTIKLKTLEAYTHKDNESSARVLLKNDFRPDTVKKDKNNAHNIIYRREN